MSTKEARAAVEEQFQRASALAKILQEQYDAAFRLVTVEEKMMNRWLGKRSSQ